MGNSNKCKEDPNGTLVEIRPGKRNETTEDDQRVEDDPVDMPKL